MQRHLLFPLFALPLLAVSPARAQMTAPAILPPVVSVQTAAVPGLMDALLQQKTSPQDLWNSGQLNGDLLVQVLGEPQWGSADNQLLTNQLCALLVEKAPEEIKDPLSLPPRTRLQLAQYFKSIKDARAVTFYEAILSLIKAPREAGVREVFDLSDYYTAIGDWQKAAETRLRMKDYTTAEPFIANANLEAAQMYAEHGQLEKAQPLYDRAEKSSYGWAAGMTINIQGLNLIRQGKYDDAVKVLSTPISGQYADQVKIGLLANLGYSYYCEGKFDLAKDASNLAIQQYDSLKNPLQGEGIQSQVDGAKETLRWIERWAKQAIVVDPERVGFYIGNGDTELTGKLEVFTRHTIPLLITSTDPSLSAEVHDVPPPSDGSYIYYAQKEVIFKLDTRKINADKDVSLKIANADTPEEIATIPVQITVQSPIELSSANAFFGFVRVGEAGGNDITLTASKPFHILKVQADAPEVQVKFDASQNSEQHILQLQLTATESGKTYQGQIHVTTDLPGQRELNIAYYGYAQN